MLVRALVTFVSPAGSADAGTLLEVSPEQGVDWIKAGLVERAAPIEEQVRQAPEVAVTRKGRR